MPLNNSTGNMYEFVTHTFNTIKGECPHLCSYCYMRKWGKQNPIRFDEKELKTDLGSGNFIFVGSSCDMFAEDIPDKWIIDTIDHCEKFDNKYLFQTKNPERFLYFKFPKSIFCTTIESNIFYNKIMKNSPTSYNRAKYMGLLSDRGFKTYVTIEPIMDFNLIKMINLIKQCHPEQVNIGADSGNNKMPEPSKDEILALISELEKFTNVKLKSNLNRLIK